MIAIPILGALALAVGTIMQKRILRYKKVGIELYNCLEFLAIVGVMIPIIYFFWELKPEAFQPINLFIMLLVVIFSIIANLLLFYSLKGGKLTSLEPGKVMEPLFVILLAIAFSFIFSEELFERNLKVIIPAIIAGVALIVTHIERHHLKFSKYFIAMIFSSLFFALELVISKFILNYYSPMSFYFLRSLIILIISISIFKPKLTKTTFKIKWELLVTGIIWVVYRISMYWGYQELGIVATTLVIMLGPIFIYTLAYTFLKEKIKWKNFIAALIIIGCVVYASIF